MCVCHVYTVESGSVCVWVDVLTKHAQQQDDRSTTELAVERDLAVAGVGVPHDLSALPPVLAPARERRAVHSRELRPVAARAEGPGVVHGAVAGVHPVDNVIPARPAVLAKAGPAVLPPKRRVAARAGPGHGVALPVVIARDFLRAAQL